MLHLINLLMHFVEYRALIWCNYFSNHENIQKLLPLKIVPTGQET